MRTWWKKLKGGIKRARKNKKNAIQGKLVVKEKSKVRRLLSLARYESVKMAQKKPTLKKATYKNQPH